MRNEVFGIALSADDAARFGNFHAYASAVRAGYRDIISSAASDEDLAALLARYTAWRAEVRDPKSLRALADIERDAIANAIFVCRGQMSLAARQLQIGRSTLYRKVEQYQIDVTGRPS